METDAENTVNAALRTMRYDTKVDISGHGFRAMACSALVKSVLRSETAIERQLSHKDRNKVRAAYTHKAEFLEERRLHELVEPVPGGQPAGACHSA